MIGRLDDEVVMIRLCGLDAMLRSEMERRSEGGKGICRLQKRCQSEVKQLCVVNLDYGSSQSGDGTVHKAGADDRMWWKRHD